MKPSALSVLVKISIIVFALCGVLICLLAYPEQVTAATLMGENRTPTPEENNIINVQVIFYRAVSIPCFLVLVLFWRLSDTIRKYTVFSIGTAKLLKICSIILLVNVFLLIIGNIVMSCLGWNIFLSIKAVLPVAGITIAATLYLLSHFINEAARFKEESACII